MALSPFAQKVNKIVAKIPPGSVATYKEVAIKAGNERSARAVARVMAMNYDPNIPCHRVICSNGTLGGYNRGGETTKRVILESEGYLHVTVKS